MEATGDPVSGTIDAGAVGRLLVAVDPDPAAGALHRVDRYALQVTATGSNPAEALFSTISRWAEAIRQLGLPAWDLVRAEVLTPEELERDFQDDLRRHPHGPRRAAHVRPRRQPGHRP